jgi:hypothetical protein
MSDINPDYYKKGDKQVFEMMLDIWGVEKYIAFCEMNAFKYRMRLGDKPDQPVERDLAKAKWYETMAKKLRAENKALKFASIQFASIGVNIGLNLFFMLYLFDPSRPEEGVLFILFANLIASLVKPLLLYRDFLSIKFSFDLQLAKEMLVYSIPLVIAGFAGIINETLDRILLKHITYDGLNPASLNFAEEQVGIYSACYKLAM